MYCVWLRKVINHYYFCKACELWLLDLARQEFRNNVQGEETRDNFFLRKRQADRQTERYHIYANPSFSSLCVHYQSRNRQLDFCMHWWPENPWNTQLLVPKELYLTKSSSLGNRGRIPKYLSQLEINWGEDQVATGLPCTGRCTYRSANYILGRSHLEKH